jgi:hypothetical protein
MAKKKKENKEVFSVRGVIEDVAADIVTLAGPSLAPIIGASVAGPTGALVGSAFAGAAQLGMTIEELSTVKEALDEDHEGDRVTEEDKAKAKKAFREAALNSIGVITQVGRFF